MTQQQLADTIGASKATISRWESDIDAPEFVKLPRLRAALRVSLDDLICGAAHYEYVIPYPSGRIAEPGYVIAPPHKTSVLSAPERQLIENYRLLPDQKRIAILGLLTPDRQPIKSKE